VRNECRAECETVLRSDAAGGDVKGVSGEKQLAATANPFQSEVPAVFFEVVALMPELSLKATFLGLDAQRQGAEE